MNQPTPDRRIEQIDRNIRANATSDLDKRFRQPNENESKERKRERRQANKGMRKQSY